MKNVKSNFSFLQNSKPGLSIVIGLFMFLASPIVMAQEHWSLEIRPDVAFPTQELGDADLSTGFGIDGMVAYLFMPHLSAYAGWGWHQFSADQSFAGTNIEFEETGYTFGLQFIHPIGETKLNYLARAGGIINHIEAENSDGDIIADTGHGLGWQIEAGLVVPLSDRWQVLPSVRYRSLSRDMEVGETSTAVDLSYLSVGVGISWSF